MSYPDNFSTAALDRAMRPGVAARALDAREIASIATLRKASNHIAQAVHLAAAVKLSIESSNHDSREALRDFALDGPDLQERIKEAISGIEAGPARDRDAEIDARNEG